MKTKPQAYERMPASDGRDARHNRNGFTLVELLVVIAILSLLISLVLPSLGTARKRGELTKCRSNLRQLAAMGHTYANENNENMVMPFTGRTDPNLDWASTGEGWLTAFTRELGSVTNTQQNVMHCPTQFKTMQDLSNQTTYTYTENHQLTSEAFGDSIRNGGAQDRTNMKPVKLGMLFSLKGDSRNGRRPASPDNVAFFTDGWHNGSGYITWRIRHHVTYYLSLGQASLESAFPHDWKCNVAFLDGHVETTTYNEGFWAGTNPIDWNMAYYWKRNEGKYGRGRDNIRAF